MPKTDCETPVPAWKRSDWAHDALTENDPAHDPSREVIPRQGPAMATYILLSTLSTQGVQTLKSNPDRLREVNKDVEELGAGSSTSGRRSVSGTS